MSLRLCSLIVCMAVFAGFGLTGCTSTIPEGKPMPELTFEHMAPFPVNVAKIDVENQYDPASDPQDVSSSFPSPPDIMLRRYAENRLQPVGQQGTLKFVIEDSHIHHSLVQPAGKFTGWLGIDRKDLYEVVMRLRMFEITADGHERTNAVLNLRRSISIPQRYSVAEKDIEKFKFLEMLMQDVDEANTVPLAPLSAPEAR